MKKMNTNEIKALARRGLVLMLVAVMVIGILPTGSVLATETPGESSEPTVETTVAAEETTAPSETTEATEAPSETTQPSETTEPSTEATEPSTEATDPTEESTEATEASAYEQIVADLDALAEEAKTLEATVEACDAFYAKLMMAYSTAYDLNEVGKITDAELEAIDEKVPPIVEFLKDEYGYVNGNTELLADGKIAAITNSTTLNATVKIFNYDSTINSQGLGSKGYKFHNGTATWEAVDGVGSSFTKGSYNEPKMTNLLENGYPNTSEGSMAYLFDGTATRQDGTALKGTMTNGGGLFQKIAGYYIYDSAVNAAYYNGSNFTLYDGVVRPGYAANDNDVHKGNFLPFNDPATQTAESDCTTSGGVSGYALNSPTDLWFGMTVEFDFNMPTDGKMGGQDMIFDFHGDDDVFVYIDDVLILDIGGTHGAESGTINFATGEVEDPTTETTGSTTLKQRFIDAGKFDESNFDDNTFADWTNHNLKFFYLERGGNISYCRLKFNMEPLPKGTVQVTKELDNRSVTSYGKSLDFTFTLTKSDGTVVDNSPYTIPGVEGTKYTNANGQFTLKADQTAYFADLESKNTYVVTEEDGLVADLSHIKYNGEIIYDGVNDKENEGFYVDPNEPNRLHSVVFTNTLEETKFTVSKTVSGNMGDRSKAFTFTAELKDADGTHIDFPAPEAGETNYSLENKNAVFNLKHGESRSFDNIPLGSYITITEVSEADDSYDTTCEITVPEGGGEGSGNGNIATISKLTSLDGAAVEFTNKKEVTIDTGISLDAAPFVLILAIAAGGFVLLRKRRSFDD